MNKKKKKKNRGKTERVEKRNREHQWRTEEEGEMGDLGGREMGSWGIGFGLQR